MTEHYAISQNRLAPGELFQDDRTLTRTGSQGQLRVDYDAPTGGEFQLVMLRAKNGDTVGRDTVLRYFGPGGLIAFLRFESSLSSEGSLTWPSPGGETDLDEMESYSPVYANADAGVGVSGEVNDVAVGEDGTFNFVCRTIGGDPVITTVTA